MVFVPFFRFFLVVVIIPVQVTVGGVQFVAILAVWVVVGFPRLDVVPFEGILVGKDIIYAQVAANLELHVGKGLSVNAHERVRPVAGGPHDLVAVDLFCLYEFVDKDVFRHVITACGVLTFQKAPFPAVLVRHVGEKDRPCHDAAVFIREVCRLCPYRILIERIPVPVRHAGIKIPPAFPAVVDFSEIAVHMELQAAGAVIGEGVPFFGKHVTAYPVYDTRRKGFPHLRLKHYGPHELG